MDITTTKEETTYGVPRPGEDTHQVEGDGFFEICLFDEETTYRAPDAGGVRAARDAVLSLDLFPDLERRVVRAYGPGPGIMLHQLLYWYSRPGMADRWRIYKTTEELQDERGIGRKVIEGARKVLKAKGVLSERRGMRGKLYYELDWALLAKTLDLEIQNVPLVGQSQNVPLGVHAHTGEYRHKITSSLRGADALEGENRQEQEQVVGRESAQQRHSLDQPTQQQVPAAPEAARKQKETIGKDFATLLKAGFRKAQKSLPSDLGKHGAIFRDMDRGDVTAEQVSQHIVACSPARKLYPNDALKEILGKDKPAASGSSKGTPAAGVKYIREYEIKRYAPGDRIGPSIAKEREKFAKIAERWDFTSDKEPPVKIRVQISKNFQFCDELIPRLRQMAKKGVREAAEAEADKGSRARAAMMSPLPTNKPASGARIDFKSLVSPTTTPEPQEEPTTKEVCV